MSTAVLALAVTVSFVAGLIMGARLWISRTGLAKVREDLAAAMTNAVETTAVMEIRPDGLRIISTHKVNGEEFKIISTFNVTDADRFVDVWTRRRRARSAPSETGAAS